MIELTTYEGIPGGAVRADWELLVDEDPAGTIFHTPRYLDTWLGVLGERVSATVHAVHRDGRLIGIVPEGHDRVGSITGPTEVRAFLGGTDVTDYRGPVARPEDRDDVMSAYVDQLAGDVDWDEWVAAGLPDDTGWPDMVERHSARRELVHVATELEEVCPVVDLGAGYDAWLQSLPGKQRHELRRKARKLARDAGEVDVRDVPADEVADQLDGFFEMAASNESEKAGFFRREPMRRFFHALADEFAEDRTLRLHVLSVAGTPGAATVSLVHGGRWALYNSAFDPALRMFAPGMVLVGELIEEAAREGCTTFDLLRGDEPYKYRFGAVDRRLRRVTMERTA